MILLSLIFVMVIIKQFRFDMKFAKHLCVIFTIMFGVLCFSRPEAIIAKYNTEMYQLKELDTDAILDMSDDGLLAALNEGAVTAEEINDVKYAHYERRTYGRYNIPSMILDSMTEE